MPRQATTVSVLEGETVPLSSSSRASFLPTCTLIQRRLRETIDSARKETGAPVHLIGHSLGGVIARAVAAQRPRDVESIITLGAPIQGAVCHGHILRALDIVGDLIKRQHGGNVLPHCYTGRCTCDFVDSLRRDLPAGVDQTAVFTKQDGIVDWRYCMSEDPAVDVEVTGTHIGLVINSAVYGIKRIASQRASPAAQNDRQKPRHLKRSQRTRYWQSRTSRFAPGERRRILSV